MGKVLADTFNGLWNWIRAARVRWQMLLAISNEMHSVREAMKPLEAKIADLRNLQRIKQRDFRAELAALRPLKDAAHSRLHVAASAATEAGESSAGAASDVQRWHRRDAFWNGGKTPKSSWLFPDANDLARSKRHRDWAHADYRRAKNRRDTIWKTEIVPLKEEEAAIRADRDRAYRYRFFDEAKDIADLQEKLLPYQLRLLKLEQRRAAIRRGEP